MFGKKSNGEPEFEYFTIYDSKTKSYREPMLCINRFDLIRQIENMFLDKKEQERNPLFLNAEDFSVFKVGEYDKKSGIIISTQHEHIANLHDLRSVVQQKGALSST